MDQETNLEEYQTYLKNLNYKTKKVNGTLNIKVIKSKKVIYTSIITRQKRIFQVNINRAHYLLNILLMISKL